MPNGNTVKHGWILLCMCRDIVMRLLHELNEEGKTVIIVTHDQGIIEDEPYVVKI